MSSWDASGWVALAVGNTGQHPCLTSCTWLLARARDTQTCTPGTWGSAHRGSVLLLSVYPSVCLPARGEKCRVGAKPWAGWVPSHGPALATESLRQAKSWAGHSSQALLAVTCKVIVTTRVVALPGCAGSSGGFCEVVVEAGTRCNQTVSRGTNLSSDGSASVLLEGVLGPDEVPLVHRGQ